MNHEYLESEAFPSTVKQQDIAAVQRDIQLRDYQA